MSHNTSYCLIEVVTKAGLTVDIYMKQHLFDQPHDQCRLNTVARGAP